MSSSTVLNLNAKTRGLSAFSSLIAEMRERRSAMQICLKEDNAVAISLTTEFLPGYEVKGRWVSGFLDGRQQSKNGLFMSPLCFQFEKFVLPYNALCTLGRYERPLSDFIMRNVFLNILCGRRVYFNRANNIDLRLDANKTLSTAYLLILKSSFKADSENRFFHENAVLGAHLNNCQPFVTKYLNRGLAGLNSVVCDKSKGSGSLLLARYLSARENLMRVL